MAVEACDKQKLMGNLDDDDDDLLVFKRISSSSKQNQSNYETKKSVPQKHDQQLGRLTADVCYPFDDDDDDDDDEPLVFKRIGSSSKQNQSNSETKKSVSQKHDQHLGRPTSDIRSQNGQNNIVQKSKMVPSSKTPPDRSPLMRPKSSNSSTKGLAVKSVVDSKPSTSMTNESNSVKRQIKGESAFDESTRGLNDDLEDSEDDKLLSFRLLAARPKVNSGNANRGANSSYVGQKSKIPKSEDLDDEIPLSSKFGVKSNVGDPTHRPTSGEKKPLLAECGQNGSASMERKPSTVLKKRIGDRVKPADGSFLKKPKLSETSTLHKNKESSVKAEMKEEDDEDHVPISQRIKKSASSDKKPTPVKKMTKATPAITKKFNKKLKKIMETQSILGHLRFLQALVKGRSGPL